jgi:hypothetical protein
MSGPKQCALVFTGQKLGGTGLPRLAIHARTAPKTATKKSLSVPNQIPNFSCQKVSVDNAPSQITF